MSANEIQLRSVNIKGKEYVEVHERIRHFRSSEEYTGWQMVSEWLELTEKRAICLTKILNPKGILIATGTAYEDANSSFINKTSYIENCETSSWGRALANIGIGVDVSVASSLEVQNAINNQTKEEKPKEPKEFISKEQANSLKDYAIQMKQDMHKVMEFFKIERLSQMTIKQYNFAMNKIKNKEFA